MPPLKLRPAARDYLFSTSLLPLNISPTCKSSSIFEYKPMLRVCPLITADYVIFKSWMKSSGVFFFNHLSVVSESEWVSDRANEWVIERISEWESEWVSERANEWVRERAIGCVNKLPRVEYRGCLTVSSQELSDVFFFAASYPCQYL